MSPKIWNHSAWISITNPAILKEKFDFLLAHSTFNVLNFTEHHFEPEGWTALWLLGESHLAIHTFPEHGTSYVEMSSCMLDKYIKYLHGLELIIYWGDLDKYLSNPVGKQMPRLADYSNTIVF